MGLMRREVISEMTILLAESERSDSVRREHVANIIPIEEPEALEVLHHEGNEILRYLAVIILQKPRFGTLLSSSSTVSASGMLFACVKIHPQPTSAGWVN